MPCPTHASRLSSLYCSCNSAPGLFSGFRKLGWSMRECGRKGRNAGELILHKQPSKAMVKQLVDNLPCFLTCGRYKSDVCSALSPSLKAQLLMPFLAIDLITQPVTTSFPSPHFPAGHSSDHLPKKLLPLNYLSQGLLLGKSNLIAGLKHLQLQKYLSVI